MTDVLADLLLNICIAAVLFFYFAWDLPEESAARRLVYRLAKPLRWLGFDHDWSMFAPSPPAGNMVAEFELQYADETTDTVHLEEAFGRVGVPPTSMSTRYVKLQVGLMWAPDSALKPSFCRYLVARYGRLPEPSEAVDSPRLSVVALRFVGLLQRIPPMQSGELPRYYQREDYHRRVMHEERFTEPLTRITAARGRS
jgi:hypothetical protein